MKPKGINSIKQILQEIAKRSHLKEKLDQVEVINQLEEEMGDHLKKYITNKYFKNKIIHLKLSSSVLRNELSYKKEELIGRINDRIGEKLVKDIVLK